MNILLGIVCVLLILAILYCLGRLILAILNLCFAIIAAPFRVTWRLLN